jgi:hypothetical protein
MSRSLKAVLVVTIVIVIAVALVTVVFQVALDSWSTDYSGARITPDIIRHYCPAYVTLEGARILHVRNNEGMTGGQTTIQFELPANQLPVFLENSPFEEARLESKSVPGAFLDPSWLPQRHYDELENNKRFSAASISVGQTHYIILIDRTRSDVYVIYFQITS